MTADKRKRSVNFSTEEKIRFLRILRENGQVIITKVTSHDLQTNRLKEDAWTAVTNELNSTSSIIRTKDNLKKLWQKMKTEAKAKVYSQTNGTGGSSRTDDPVLEEVADLAGYGSSAGGSTSSEVDSDEGTESQMGVKPAKRNLKRRWPTPNYAEPSNIIESERVKSEKETRALIELKRQQMKVEHAINIKNGELKTKILETVLKKVQDGTAVDPELLKVVSNM